MSLALFLCGAVAAAALALWSYRRREPPVAGRGALAAVRAAALVLVLLLLFDPRLPGTGGEGDADRWVLVDASTSMAVGAPGERPWDRAVTRAGSLRSAGARVLRFGDAPPAPPADTALSPPPADPRSLLVPALERAAEAGAREVVVLSDLRLEDPVAVRSALDRLGLGARFVSLGEAVRNAGIASLELTSAVEAGASVSGELALFAEGVSEGDSILVELREEGRLVWSGRVSAPSPGRITRVPLELPSPAATGEVRYEARASLDGDRFPADDGAVSWVVADPREGTLLLVSLSPDWEPAHLLPVLERVTGLPARGYLRVGERFLPMSSGIEAGGTVDADMIRERARSARLLVLHGLGADAPEWARGLAGAGRGLIFARDPEGAAAAGVAVGAARPGEWYLDAEPPPSPIAGDLAGVAFAGLPPLVELLPRTAGDGTVVLEARLRGTGPVTATVVLRQGAEGRTAAVLASGWWRWALRPGAPDEAYARVWSAVAGWLLADGGGASRSLRPTARVVAPGTPVEWSGGGEGPVRLTVRAETNDSAALDTTLALPDPGLRTRPLPPGSYRYRVEAAGDTTNGRFDVHAVSAELRYPPMAVPDSIPPPPGRSEGVGPGRPLRTHPLPYLLLLGLLCGEWVARRRKGLR